MCASSGVRSLAQAYLAADGFLVEVGRRLKKGRVGVGLIVIPVIFLPLELKLVVLLAALVAGFVWLTFIIWIIQHKLDLVRGQVSGSWVDDEQWIRLHDPHGMGPSLLGKIIFGNDENGIAEIIGEPINRFIVAVDAKSRVIQQCSKVAYYRPEEDNTGLDFRINATTAYVDIEGEVETLRSFQKRGHEDDGDP